MSKEFRSYAILNKIRNSVTISELILTFYQNALGAVSACVCVCVEK